MRESGSSFCRPHAELVEEHRRANNSLTTSTDAADSAGSAVAESKREDDQCSAPDAGDQADLARRLMQTVTEFEAQARQLLLDNLDHSLARTLLVADRNCKCLPPVPVQAQMLILSLYIVQDRSGAPPGQKGHASLETTMAEVERYRSLFAEVLVLGSMVQGLEGEEQATFERRSMSTERQAQSPVAPDDIKQPSPAGGVGQDQAASSWVDGLRGLSKIMYRQHTRQLKRAYSVA